MSRGAISFQDLARQLQQTADVLQQTLDEKLVAEQQRDAGSRQLAELLRSQTTVQQQLDHTQNAYNAALRTLKDEQTKRKEAESLLQQATKQVSSLQLDLKSSMVSHVCLPTKP
jgi:hypothetical protein